MVKAILFDIDGVLVDACDLHYQALNAAFREAGYPEISIEDHYAHFNGRPTKTKFSIYHERIQPLSDEAREQISKRKQELTLEMVSLLPVNPEIVELLRKVKEAGLLVAAASNSLHISIVKMLEATGLIDFVDVIVGNDDVPNPKPAPDVYLKAAELLEVSMEECTIVEDSPVGIQAAIAAYPYKINMVQDVLATATLTVEDLT